MSDLVTTYKMSANYYFAEKRHISVVLAASTDDLDSPTAKWNARAPLGLGQDELDKTHERERKRERERERVR